MPGAASGPIGPRVVVVGIELDGASAAYPLAVLRERSPVNAQIGAAQVLLVVDGNSVRSFPEA